MSQCWLPWRGPAWDPSLCMFGWGSGIWSLAQYAGRLEENFPGFGAWNLSLPAPGYPDQILAQLLTILFSVFFMLELLEAGADGATPPIVSYFALAAALGFY